MRILYHPQVSMRSYTDPPKWLLSSDAQLTKMRAYVEELPQDWRWYWLLPDAWQCDAWPVDGGPNVYSIAVPHMDNVLEERFNFPFRELAETYDDVRPDLILCEVPEHVRAWRAVQDKVDHRCPIVAMVEHVDFYDETKAAARVSFMLRQVDGHLAADLTVFPLEGMRREWMKNVAASMGDTMLDAVNVVRGPTDPHAVWPGLFSPKEVDVQYAAGRALKEAMKVEGLPIVFLISRLSDPTRTRYEEIIGASNDLLAQGKEHVLWVANPNEAKDWQWVRSNARAYEEHPFGEKRLERHEYLQLLWAADVVPIMYDMSRIYSVGACEAAAAGNQIVTVMSDPPYGLMAPTEARADLGIALEVAMDPRSANPWRDAYIERCGIERHADGVRTTIEGLVSARAMAR